MSIIGMRTKMSKYLKGLVLLLAVAFAVGFIAMTIGGGKLGPDAGNRGGTGVLVKVNGQEIMWKDYEDLLQRQMEQYSAQGPVGPSTEIQLRGSLFDEMVNEAMWVQAAKKDGIKVSRGELKKKIDEYTDLQMKQMREQLLAGKKKKTDAVFEAQLAKMEPGMSIKKKRNETRKKFQDLSDQIRNSMMIEKLNKKIQDSVAVNDKALEESYDFVTLSQITVAGAGKRSDEQAKKRIDEIAAKIKGGDDFASLAKQYSDDMYKDMGGRRGPVQRAFIESELKDVAFKLGAGKTSDPVKTAQGYVIVKSDGVKRNLPGDFNDAKKKREYKDSFAQQARDTARSEYEAKLRKELKLEVLDPELKAYVGFRDAYQSIMSMAQSERKKTMDGVIKLYETAVAEAGDRQDVQARCYIQLATLYRMMGSSPMFGVSPADQGKYAKQAREALESALGSTEDNGLRMALARMALDAKDYKAVEENLQIASENAYDDMQAHEQIRDMYKEMKRADLAAAEQKWIDDYKKDQGDSGNSVTTQPIRIPSGGQ